MRRLLICSILFLVFRINIAYAVELDEPLKDMNEEFIMEQLDDINIEVLESFIEKVNQDTGKYLPKLNVKEIIFSLMKGEETLNLFQILNGLLKYIFKEILANSALLVKLMILAIICGFLNNLSTAFESHAVGSLANTVCYLVIIGIAMKSFSIAITIGIESVNNMVSFMQALLPVLLTLLMAMGGITTSAMFQPVILASVEIVSTLMKNIIMPIIFFSAILSIVNHLSPKIQVSKLASLLKHTCIVLIGFILTIFTGIITIQGVTASTADGVVAQTAKFAIDTFIPVVGGFVSEAFDTILGYSLLLKNAIGGIGFIVLTFIVITPLLKILSLIFIYKATSALIEPIAENQLIDCLNDMSNAMILVFATVLSVAIMFFMAITIIVATGNITLMMR